MRTGANRVDQERIKKMAEGGMPAAAIAKQLDIDPKVVKSFVPKKVKE